MDLAGFGPLILRGTLMTLQVGLLALLGSMLVGIIGASCKLSKSRILRGLGAGYTTLIRSVPDLVLMLLIFFSLQILLNDITDWLQVGQLDIDPFIAGVLTMSFIYGAYFTETFRGAILTIPQGQVEAGIAFGINRMTIFRHIVLPQMMRFALPGISNNWQILIKATALISIIGLNDLLKTTQDAGKTTTQYFFFSLVCAAVYLLIATISNIFMIFLTRYYSTGTKRIGQ